MEWKIQAFCSMIAGVYSLLFVVLNGTFSFLIVKDCFSTQRLYFFVQKVYSAFSNQLNRHDSKKQISTIIHSYILPNKEKVNVLFSTPVVLILEIPHIRFRNDKVALSLFLRHSDSHFPVHA